MMLTALTACDEKKQEKEKIDLTSFVVAKTEHYEMNGAMYAFFLYDFVGQYSSYLPYWGYDVTRSLRDQTSKCALDETKTWFEYFSGLANSYIEQCLSAYEAAYAAGFMLKDEELAQIDDYIKEQSANAVKNGYKNLDELIADYYIEGITTETFKECIILQQLAYSYMNGKSDEIEFTDEDLIKYRDEHPEDFLMIDVIQYRFTAEYVKDATDDDKAAADAVAKKKAEDFLNKNKTVDAFENGIVEIENEGVENPKKPETILSDYIFDAEYYNAEGAADETYKAYYEWAYSDDRNAGDTFLLEEKLSSGEMSYAVYCIIEPVYINDYATKDCRHILFYVDNNETDKDKLASAKAEALAKANSILDEFKNGDKTENDFKALETKCLKDESALEATAYYNVTLGYMVTEFENWIYGERTPGDCEIVETQFGYHIVYFIGDGIPAWKIDAKSGYISEVMTEYQEDIIELYKVIYDNENLNKIP